MLFRSRRRRRREIRGELLSAGPRSAWNKRRRLLLLPLDRIVDGFGCWRESTVYFVHTSYQDMQHHLCTHGMPSRVAQVAMMSMQDERATHSRKQAAGVHDDVTRCAQQGAGLVRCLGSVIRGRDLAAGETSSHRRRPVPPVASESREYTVCMYVCTIRAVLGRRERLHARRGGEGGPTQYEPRRRPKRCRVGTDGGVESVPRSRTVLAKGAGGPRGERTQHMADETMAGDETKTTGEGDDDGANSSTRKVVS